MIGKLRNSKGQWCTDPAEINELIGDYFTKIFSSEGGSCDEVIQCVEKKLMAGQNHSLMEPFTTADVRDAIFSMYPDKSPVPNGSQERGWMWVLLYPIVGFDKVILYQRISSLYV